MGKELDTITKHKLYEDSVQCPDADIDFIRDQYRNIYGKAPKTVREDFGGTGLMSCEWVRQGEGHEAWSIDLDPEPIGFGKEFHYSKLTKSEKERMHYIEGNVLDSFDFKTDVIVAFNFSYFIFKQRKQLLEYFKKVREGLNEEGAFFIDLFGGTDAREPSEEETEHEDHTYIWDCHSFNPITNECTYFIHFKKDGQKYKRVFTYDWRLYSIPELREILEEAGFSKTYAYWEGEDEDGEGDGNFYISEEEENCESWVTYIVARP